MLSRLGSGFNRCNFPSLCLKPLQVKCFEYLLNGKDIVAVLAAGVGSAVSASTGFLACRGDNDIV